MGLLKEAEIEQVGAKLGLFGIQGSGKSTTSFLIAIGLIKTFHPGGAIAMYDSEGASDFLVPIAKAEGVRFVRHKGTSFKDLVSVMGESERMGANVFIADTVSRAWVEIVEAYQKKKNRTRLEFQDWSVVKGTWREQFVDRYMVSPVHSIIVGRAGDEYDTVEVEGDNGQMKRQQERIGSKFAAEKGMGYEPNLLIEMEGRRTPDVQTEGKRRRTRKHGGRIIHVANVLKDRSRALMGKSFEFPNLNDYKVGDWKPVFNAFAPHWQFLNIGQQPAGTVSLAGSGEMFGEDAQQSRENWGRRKEIASEEIKALLVFHWPGQDAESKRIKAVLINELFAVHSWAAVDSLRVDQLEEALAVLRFMSTVMKASGTPQDESNVRKVLQAAREDYNAHLAAQVEAAAARESTAAESKELAEAGLF